MSLAVPNGGTLIDRELMGEAAEQAAQRATTLPKVELDASGVSDLLMIAVGALSPLSGFMDQVQYEAVVESMRLPGGELMGLPVTLPVDAQRAQELKIGDEVKVKITDIDFDRHRVSLSIRALLPLGGRPRSLLVRPVGLRLLVDGVA